MAEMEIIPYMWNSHAPERFAELLEQGLSYRYPLDRWSALERGGKPYSSPTRQLTVDGQPLVDELIQPTLTAVRLDQWAWQQLEELVRSVSQVLEAIADFAPAILALPTIAPFADALVDPSERPYLGTSFAGPWQLPFLRFDAVPTRNGWQIIDVNSTRPAGVGDYVLLNQSAMVPRIGYPGSPPPIGAQFVRTVRAIVRQWSDQTGQLLTSGAAVVPDQTADVGNMQVLTRLLTEQLGIALTITTPNELDARVPFVLRGRVKPRHDSFRQLVDGYPDQRLVVSTPYRRFAGNKLWAALLQLPELERALTTLVGPDAVRQSIQAMPATAFLNGCPVAGGELPAYTGQARKGLVLKPPAGSSAQGVLFGCETNAGKWERALGNGGGFTVVQPYTECRQGHLVLDADGQAVWREFYAKFGIFVLGGELAGLELMLRPSRRVHGARDTYLAPVLVDSTPAVGAASTGSYDYHDRFSDPDF